MLVDEQNFNEAMGHLYNCSEISFDIETNGLQPYHGNKICGIAMWGDGRSFYFPFRHGEGYNLPLAYMEPIRNLFKTDRVWIMWNGKFDMQFLLVEGFPPAGHVEDPMLAAHLMNENERNFKLKDLGKKYINPNAKDEQIELVEQLAARKLGIGDMWRLPAELVAPYAEQDVILTIALRDFYKRPLIRAGLFEIWLDVCKYQHIVMGMERRGMMLDMEMVDQKITECRNLFDQTQEQLNALAGYKFNPNSPKQVQALLGISGSTSVDTLAEIDHPAARLIVLGRQCTKAIGSYYDKFLDLCDYDGALHPNLFMTGTVTGRFSSGEPLNMQAIPRKDKTPKGQVKSAFISRPGHVLIQYDYKQAEVYLGAHYAQARNLIEMIQSGVDVHRQTADMLGIPRDAAKRLNFSMQYGIGAEALARRLTADGLKTTVKQAWKYLNQYNRLHPEMKGLYHTMENEAKANRFIRLFTGRIRRYDGDKSPYHKASSNLIQGGVGEIMRIASTAIYNRFGDIGVHQLLHVHDCILVEVEEGFVEKAHPQIVECMTDLHPYRFTLPFKVDAEIGTRWSELQPIDKWINDRS